MIALMHHRVFTTDIKYMTIIKESSHFSLILVITNYVTVVDIFLRFLRSPESRRTVTFLQVLHKKSEAK